MAQEYKWSARVATPLYVSHVATVEIHMGLFYEIYEKNP